jgi:hypothetical protein
MFAHKDSKTLIAGDAMNVIDGQLTGPNKQLLSEENPIMATDSLKKFKQYDIQGAISYHGGLSTDNPNQRINELF